MGQDQKIPTIPIKALAKQDAKFNVVGISVQLPDIVTQEVEQTQTNRESVTSTKPRKSNSANLDLTLASDQIMRKEREEKSAKKSGQKMAQSKTSQPNILELPPLTKSNSRSSQDDNQMVTETSLDITRIRKKSLEKQEIKPENSLPLSVLAQKQYDIGKERKPGAESSNDILKGKRNRKPSLRSNISDLSIEETAETTDGFENQKSDTLKKGLRRNSSSESSDSQSKSSMYSIQSRRGTSINNIGERTRSHSENSSESSINIRASETRRGKRSTRDFGKDNSSSIDSSIDSRTSDSGTGYLGVILQDLTEDDDVSFQTPPKPLVYRHRRRHTIDNVEAEIQTSTPDNLTLDDLIKIQNRLNEKSQLSMNPIIESSSAAGISDKNSENKRKGLENRVKGTTEYSSSSLLKPRKLSIFSTEKIPEIQSNSKMDEIESGEPTPRSTFMSNKVTTRPRSSSNKESSTGKDAKLSLVPTEPKNQLGNERAQEHKQLKVFGLSTETGIDSAFSFARPIGTKLEVPNTRDSTTKRNPGIINSESLAFEVASKDCLGQRSSVTTNSKIETPPEAKNKRKSLRASIKDEIHHVLTKHSKLLSRFRKPKLPEVTIKVTKDATLQESTFLNWLRIYHCIKLVKCVRNVYKAISKRNHTKISSIPIRDNGSLSYVLKSNVVVPDPNFVEQVQSLLREPKFKRSNEAVEKLEMLLRIRMPGFSKFPLAVRFFLCQAITLEHYDKDTILLSEGHTPTCFYFVLSGQVELVRINDGYKFRIDILNSGSVFGEQCLGINAEIRMFTAATIVDSKLLYVSKYDYVDFITKKEDQEAKSQITDTLGMYTFQDYQPFLKTLIARNFFHIYSYTKGQTIVEEGSQFNELLWILDGVCKVTRKLPFLKTQGVLEISQFNQMRNEKYVQIVVETQDLSTGEFFPNVPEIHQGILTPKDIQKNLYVEFFQKLYPSDPNTFQKMGLVAAGMVTIAAIKFTDLIPMISNDFLLKLMREPCVQMYDMRELQQKILSQEEWKATKTKVLHNFNPNNI